MAEPTSPAAKRISRRTWLLDAVALATLPAAWAKLPGEEEPVNFIDTRDFVVDAQASGPRVKYFDLRQLTSRITPNADFFVFHQTDVPRIDLATWRLEIAGLVEERATLTMAELLRRGGSEKEVEVTLECSGNVPRAHTMNGQVSNARWSGFSLAALLRQCGVRPEAREVVFFGADHARDPGGSAVAPHARSVFVQDAFDPDALLATKMNGEPLPREHGFPLRLILPGWYGMAQIKWLTRIELIDRRYEGPHMSRNYHTLHALSGTGPDQVLLETSIARTRLKSVVARVTRQRRGAAWDYRVRGAVWGGLQPIERVEVSIDRGPWSPARIEDRGGRHAWSLWCYDWPNPTAGRHTIVSRAIDSAGKAQPPLDDWLDEIKSARENNSQWERLIAIPG